MFECFVWLVFFGDFDLWLGFVVIRLLFGVCLFLLLSFGAWCWLWCFVWVGLFFTFNFVVCFGFWGLLWVLGLVCRVSLWLWVCLGWCCGFVVDLFVV